MGGNKARYLKLIQEIHNGLNGAVDEMPDVDPGELAFEVASITLIDEPWVKPYLESFGVSDIEGRLADDIYAGV